MSLRNLLLIVQGIIAASLIVIVLVQSQGSGLGNIFGGGGGETYRTKRGAEKMLFWVTVALGAGFLLISVFNLIWQ